MKDAERQKEWISDLIELQAKTDDLLRTALAHDHTFVQATKESYETFLNQGNSNLPAQLLAKYVDEQLKPSAKLTDEEVEARTTKAVSLFRHLQAQDTFEAFYRKDLGKFVCVYT